MSTHTLTHTQTHTHTQVHHIQKLNKLCDSETIHSRTTLKIPTTSSTPSPILKKNKKGMASSLQDIRKIKENGEGEGKGEEVKKKPSTRIKREPLEPFEERSIASLLSVTDVNIAEMQRFNKKLAQKT